MKMDQVAYYCVNQYAVADLKRDLSLENAKWITDTVHGQSKVAVKSSFETGENVAELQFNYDLGLELEIIRYVSGPHWHPQPLPHRLMSHVGVHLDEGEPFPLMPHSRIVQETRTLHHTSDYLTNPDSPGYLRRYHYRIHEIGPNTFIKFIRRIRPGMPHE
jgi:hypothetical protein